VRRCLGRTSNLHRCQREGDWRFFCHDHKRQPLIWLFTFIFTVLGGTASIYSVLAPSTPPIPSPAEKGISKSTQEGNLTPFPEGIFGILVLPFEGNSPEEQEKGVKIQGTITKTLSARLRELQISDAEVRAAPVSIAPLPHTHADARRFGDTYHAELLIWGDVTLAGVIPNLTIVHPLPTSMIQAETTILKDTLTHAQLTNIEDIRLSTLTDEPTLFVAFVTGLKYYHANQYDMAIKYFTFHRI
jgi:hypothetical protein